MNSILFLCPCFRSSGAEVGDFSLDFLPAAEEELVPGELLESSDSVDEEDSVDQRAERFIERFYEEMRIQRFSLEQ